MVDWFRGPKITRYKGDTYFNIQDSRVRQIVEKLFREWRTEVVIQPLGPETIMGEGFNHVTGYFPPKYAKSIGEGSGRRRIHPKQLR